MATSSATPRREEPQLSRRDLKLAILPAELLAGCGSLVRPRGATCGSWLSALLGEPWPKIALSMMSVGLSVYASAAAIVLRMKHRTLDNDKSDA